MFTIFKSTPPFLFKTQVELVLVCATLHNFLRKECRSDEFSIEAVDEPSFQRYQLMKIITLNLLFKPRNKSEKTLVLGGLV
uniref:DDE Tnp4 domain-containing protein n=1 Tax=Cajanus cajan TaxID=3821 RepID=A0A151QVB8_CAJCA|nr:hypothetical protein KK1_044820 [Cajanus cajan]